MKEPGKKYNDEDNMLVNDLRSIVSKARSKAFAAVNYSLVERNWRIGQRIVEEEQNGASRAEYGKHVIEVASAALTEEFGKGFSKTNIKSYRRFYNFFSGFRNWAGSACPIGKTKTAGSACYIYRTCKRGVSNSLYKFEYPSLDPLRASHPCRR